MNFNFTVDGQNMSVDKVVNIASDIIGKATCSFEFESTDYDNYDVLKAVFYNTKSEVSKELLIYDDGQTIPWEVMTDRGHLTCTLIGCTLEDDGETIIERLPSFPCTFASVAVKTILSGDNALEPTPTVLEQLEAELAKKQEKLIAGDNITIEGNVISATGGGKVDDVKVDGTSVVADKIASIDLTGKVDKVSGKSLISDTEIERLATVHNYDDSSVTERISAIEGQESKWDAKADKTDIPTRVSELENDSAFITKAVADLANYYKKSETYTQNEINQKISEIPKFSIKVVDVLPTEGISTTTVYLLKNGEESGNLYSEYIYVDNKWELLGAQKVDLTGYAKEEWVTAQIKDFLTETQVNTLITTALIGYAKTSDIPTKTSELENDSNLVEDAGYVHTDNNYSAEEKSQVAQNAKDITSLNEDIAKLDEEKQDKLIAGENITIAEDGKTVSAKDTVYDDTEVRADIADLGEVKVGYAEYADSHVYLYDNSDKEHQIADLYIENPDEDAQLTVQLLANDGADINTTVSITKDGGEAVTYDYANTPLHFKIEKFHFYTISFGDLAGYTTPADIPSFECLGDKLISATYRGADIYGAKQSLSSLSTSWVRADDAVNLSATATHDGTEVDNDFDNIYPWSDIKSCNILNDEVVAWYGDDAYATDGSNGDVMTYIPPFFIKRWQDESNEYIQISKAALADGFKVKGFYIGRYTTSSGIKSVSGVQSTVNQGIGTFRTQAMSKGDDWSQLDWHYFVLECLYLVEYADADSQKILGMGVCNASSQINTGGCDSLGMKSGCIANDSKSAVIYRGVENPYGNIWQFVDGINIKDCVAYICYDHASYVSDKFTDPYVALGYTDATASGTPQTMGCDSNNQLIGLPQTVGTSTYGDSYWAGSGDVVVWVGGHEDNGSGAGFFSWDCYIVSYASYSFVGGRLLKTL